MQKKTDTGSMKINTVLTCQYTYIYNLLSDNFIKIKKNNFLSRSFHNDNKSHVT